MAPFLIVSVKFRLGVRCRIFLSFFFSIQHDDAGNQRGVKCERDKWAINDARDFKLKVTREENGNSDRFINLLWRVRRIWNYSFSKIVL